MASSIVRNIIKNRGACILKKAHELSVLCGIRVCSVIIDPDGKIRTWPENKVEAVDFLKLFKKSERGSEFTAVAAAAAGKCPTEETKAPMMMNEKFDFSCFDDKLMNGLSRESVSEILKLLNSKIEAARNRAELLKMNKNKGFQQINPTPNFNQNCLLNPMQSNLPLSIRVPDSYSCRQQFGGIDLGNDWISKFEQPEIILDFSPPLSYLPSVDDNGCLNFPPPLSYLPSADHNDCSSTRVPDSYSCQQQFGGIDLGNDWISKFEQPEIILDFPPPLSYLPSVDNGCLNFPAPLTYSPSADHKDCSSIRTRDDSYFGSELSFNGSTCTENDSPDEQVVGLLQYSPLEEGSMIYGASMATVPPQPMDLLPYWYN